MRGARRSVEALVAATLAVVALMPAPASADRPYTAVFSENRQGDITGTGNTLMSCFTADPKCAAARNGTASGSDLNNNGLPMDWVDTDDDPGTFNSSSAPLRLPPGARVLAARLYYTGRLQQGADSGSFRSRPAPDPDDRDQVLFKPPDRGTYISLTADQVDDALDPNTRVAREYQGIVDVTSLVAAAGSGTYSVADVQLGTGRNDDQAGGWALAVAYEDSTQPMRNLTIFDGFQFVLADGPPVDIPLSGFLTPPNGPVTTNLGLVAMEGDLGTSGDSVTINAGSGDASKLSNAANPADNFFNASITDRNAAQLAGRSPMFKNQMGFDADIINATGKLRNNQTSTVIRLATSGDGFAPNGVSFATDLFAPSLQVDKAVDPTGPAHLGDVLTYTVGVGNTGLDAAVDTVLTDAIPAGTSYVPGSLSVVSGANAGAKSDAADGDQAEFDPVANAVVFRLGSGANGTVGGRLDVPANAPANATSIKFRVRIAADELPRGFEVVNSAGVGFESETVHQEGSVQSPDVVTPVLTPDLAITKSHEGEFKPGARVPFTLSVKNVGNAPTFGPVTVTDALPDELSFAVRPSGDGWDCGSSTDRTLTCTRSDALAPGASYPDITFTARVASDAQEGELRNTAEVDTPGDGDPTNNTDTDTGELTVPLVDMAIEKFALTPLAFPGQEVRFLLLVRNLGPDTATRVTVRDILPRGLTAIQLRPSRGGCAGTTCRLGTMAANARARILVRAVAADDTGGKRLRDVAVVRARQREERRRNNVDSASVRIVPLVDLEVTKTTATPSVTAGDPVSFTVLVQNNGPSTATQVRMVDLLPAGLTLISARPLQGTCTAATCDLGTLEPGAATQIVVVAGSDPSLAGSTVTNIALAKGREPELKLANNLATARVTFTAAPTPPVPPADVVVTKTANVAQVGVGGQVTYTITATNRGAGPAPTVIVTDTPDPGLRVDSVTPSQGTCEPGVPISCQVGPLAPGQSATVTVVATATAAGTLRNAVTVLPTTDGGGGQLAGGAVEAQAVPALTLRKRASRHVVHPGDNVTFLITVRARGTGTARAIEVCDDLPPGLSVVSTGGGRIRNGQPCWTIDRLDAGDSRTLRLRVAVSESARPGRLTNVATLTTASTTQTARARIRVVVPNPFACPSSAGPTATAAC